MSLRAFKLPDDLDVMIALIEPSFQYPENQDWNVQQDEIDSMVDSLQGARRIWPLIRVLQVFSPPVRDTLRGYIWEEDGRAVGLSNILRMGDTRQWLIANVSVLPEYRRRGIARRLVEACVGYARERQASTLTLDVIAGNTPAYSLYTALGFQHFSGYSQLEYRSDRAIDEVSVPDGYTFGPLLPSAWRVEYELAQRITPDKARPYAPVEEGRYRRPVVMRLLGPSITRAMGTQVRRFELKHGGQTVATGSTQARQRAGGVNQMRLTLDPACPEAASFLVWRLAGEIQRYSPGRPIHFEAKDWQPALLDAAQRAGFRLLAEMHSLGRKL